MQGLKVFVARQLFDLGAVKFGEFRLKLHEKNPDAPPSPIYLNLRTEDHPVNPGPLTPELMAQIGVLMVAELNAREIEFDFFTGIPDAGEPFADEIAVQTRGTAVERLRLRKERLEDGSRRIASEISGSFYAGGEVVVIDDLITQADSKLEAITSLELEKLIVSGILVLVDRQQGGKEQLEQKRYTLVSVFTLDELIDFYLAEGLIEIAKADEVRNYIAANRL